MTTISKQSILETEKLFHLHYFLWRLLGNLPTKKYRQLYILYTIFINIFITIGFPLHLLIGLFRSTSIHDTLKNGAIVVTCCCCSMKTVLIWLKFKNVRIIFDMIKRQDKRIGQSAAESAYYKSMVFPSVQKIMLLFKILSVAASLTAESTVLVNGYRGSWRLLYPGYFPIDPFASSWGYAVAHVYQYFGITFQILQNLINDTFPGMHLALLSGQIHILSMRVANIGHNRQKTNRENYQELLACIQDHLDLLQYRRQLEEVISQYMFFQILSSSMNVCATVLYIILFSSNAVTIIHYIIYLLCLFAQILPACYYGSVMEFEFQHLTHALFATNWMDQDKCFKKNLQIFAEKTNEPMYMMAWLVRINLKSFLSACKNAYSLFAVAMNVK